MDQGNGAGNQRCRALNLLELFVFDDGIIGQLIVPVRIVIPVFVRGHHAAPITGRLEPLMAAAGTQAARPKGVPYRPTAGRAPPPIGSLRAPGTERAVDFRFALH